MQFKLPNLKIDWPNHLIGFFSALFGILIAFELEEWREHRNNQREAQEAMAKLKDEILINKNSLHEAVTANQQLISILGAQTLPQLNEHLVYQGSIEDAKRFNKEWYPVARIEIQDSTQIKITAPVHLYLNQLILPTLHYAAWESAKETGVMNSMEYDKVLTVSYLYNTPRIQDEWSEIRRLLRLADDKPTKSDLQKLLRELGECHRIIETELQSFNAFANMVEGME